MPQYHPCHLEVSSSRYDSIAAVWAALPAGGSGYVVFADAVETLPLRSRSGEPFLEAEVSEGRSTIRVQLRDGAWHAWTWRESDGTSHEYVEEHFATPNNTPQGGARYRTYWTRQDAGDGVLVWQPVGARFVGFGEGGPRD